MTERLAEGRDRRTKIVATIGPVSSTEEALQALLHAGMDVARLNFSHGTPEEHRETIRRLRRLAEERQVPVAVLQDLTGPKVRIGAFAAGTAELHAGAPFTLTTRAIVGSPEAVSVSYAGLPEAVAPGDRLLLADGTIELLVREVEGSEIRCTVVTGGTLAARKGVNVPSGLPDLPILGEKDLRDLRFGMQHGVDYVGLSFVRTAEDIRTAKRELARLGGDTPVIAKIETRSALDHLDEILAEADGVMVARGDLSIETAFTRVPIVQKVVIAEANRRAKPGPARRRWRCPDPERLLRGVQGRAGRHGPHAVRDGPARGARLRLSAPNCDDPTRHERDAEARTGLKKDRSGPWFFPFLFSAYNAFLMRTNFQTLPLSLAESAKIDEAQASSESTGRLSPVIHADHRYSRPVCWLERVE